jgi:hypothetical protein
MPIVRRLSDTDDIAFSTGLGGVDGLAYGTIAILFRPAVDPVLRWIVTLHDLVGASLGAIGVLGGDPLLLWQGGGIWGTEGPAVTIDDWHLLVARKGTGDVRPRWSLKNLATGIWVHEDGTETQLDWTPPTGGSVRTLDAASGYGASSDFAAAAIWANSLPWAADAGGDAAIEAAGLDEHLDNWRDAEPSSGWEFSQPDALLFVEDFTLNRADETTAGVGTPTTATDLDFIYAAGSILALSRNYLRSTQDEPGAGGIIRDLSETQGTPTTVGSGNISTGGFTEVLRFWRVVDAAVDAGVAIDTSIAMAAVSASTLQYRWIVHRYNSADVLQESSTPSTAHNTAGVKTQTMALAGPFVAGDKLALSLELGKAGGGGSRSFTLNINHADSWVEFSVAEVAPAIVTASIPLAVAVAPAVAADHAVTADIPLAVAVGATVAAPSATGLVSGEVSINPATLSCAVGERLVCIAWSRGGGTSFGVTPNAGGSSWTNRVVEATLPTNDLARRSVGVAELVPASTVTDGVFTAAWSGDATDAIWLRVQEGGSFGFADAAVADSDTSFVTSLATGNTASIPAGDLLLVAAAVIRDGGAAGTTWANTDINPGLVGGGNLLLDGYAGKGAGGNGGVAGYLLLDGQGAGVRADTLSLPGGDAAKQMSVALVVWSTGVTSTPQVAAAIPLTLAVGAAAEAEHQATADVGLAVTVAGVVEADHAVTAAVPLALEVAAVVDAPAGASEVTAGIGLSVAVAGTAAAEHRVVADVPLSVATAAIATAQHQVTATVPLQLGVAAVVVAPVVGAPGQVTAAVPLSLSVVATTATTYQAAAGIPLALVVAPVVDAPEVVLPGQVGATIPLALSLVATTTAGYLATATVPLSLSVGAVGGADHAVVADVPLGLALGATVAAFDPTRPGTATAVAGRTASATVIAQRVPTGGVT